MNTDQIIDGMQACVLALTKQGIVTYANRSARESLSLSSGDDVFMRLGHEGGLAEFLERCSKSTAVLHCRLRISKDLSSPAWEFHGQPLRRADGTDPQVLLQVERVSQSAVELRARELEHRFKNSVQMMIAALDLARRHIADESARAALASAMQQVQAIAHVQSIATRVAAEHTLAAQDFLETLCDAVRRSLATHCPIECVASMPGIPVGLATPIALIINELVTNAVKYGSSDRTDPIRVRLDRGADAIVVTVADKGPGFALEACAGGTGLGLVRELVRQLAGSFTVDSRAGTRCVVEIPFKSFARGEAAET